MKKITFIIASIFFTQVMYSQSIDNALKFSQNFPNGTARSIGMGGSFGSLGGDFSAIDINPAGLGVYRSSEFVFSGGYQSLLTESNYLNNKQKTPENQFVLNNVSFVGVFNNPAVTEGWVSTALALGYTRTNNYFNRFDIDGIDETTMADYFLSNVGETHPDYLDSYYERLAFDTRIIDTLYATNDPLTLFENNPEYFTEVPLDDIYKRNSFESSGRNGNFLISFAANYSHKLYLGASLAISSVHYNFKSKHYEENTYGTIVDTIQDGEYFDYFNYISDGSTEGNGVSFKLGVIYRPIDFLRLGLSVQLPTYYTFTDKYYASMESNYRPGEIIKPTDIDGYPLGDLKYQYEFTTPTKTVFSIGYQLQKFALFNIDIEHIDYSNMRFDDAGDGYDYFYKNQDFASVFRAVNNIRAGAEFRVGPFALRGGYNFYPSPYKQDDILFKNASYSLVSGGVGYKQKEFFVDFGVQSLMHKEKYMMYDYYIENYKYPEITTKNMQFISTVGFRF